ncbi:hypothetical protein D3C72_1010890 [compost metagenome]
MLCLGFCRSWRRRPGVATATAQRRRQHGLARSQLLWPARLSAQQRPVAGGARRQGGREGRGDPDPERQLRLQPVDERPFVAGGLYGLGRQPGTAGHRRADGCTAGRTTGDRHRPAPGGAEKRSGLCPCRAQGAGKGHSDHRPENRRVADRRRTGLESHQFAVRLRCVVRRAVRPPRGDPRQRPGEFCRNPQGRGLRQPASG